MRILFLTQIIPYPPDAGPKVKTWHVLRYLAESGHQVILASFIRPEEKAYVEALRRVCAEVYTVDIHRSRILDMKYWLYSHLTGRPFLIERDDIAAMRQLIQKLLLNSSIDCIQADQLTMAQYALPTSSPRSNHIFRKSNLSIDQKPYSKLQGVSPYLVFDAHNAVWSIVERMSQTQPWYLRPVLKVESRRIKRYEGMVIHQFDHTLAVTEIDRENLLRAQAAYTNGSSFSALGKEVGDNRDRSRITVIPISVDTNKIQPIVRKPNTVNILTLGTLHYPPNADGVRWFTREVFPLIRQEMSNATLTIIGKNPPTDLVQLGASDRAIEVTGYVPDLNPYLQQAAMVIVPVRAGSGMRVRILEAFAFAMPVVTTTIGLEGIDARPGVDVVVADTPVDFANSVIEVLQNDSMQDQLAINGRSLAVERYDWQVALRKLGKVYKTIETSSS